jgi:threonine synthase
VRSPSARLSCPTCAETFESTQPIQRCSSGHLLDLELPDPGEAAASLISLFDDRKSSLNPLDLSGVWRFRELVLSDPPCEPITYPEGNTPLLHSNAVGEWAGIDSLQLKHEGYNPTGSFKDRGMTVGITQAVGIGARGVACASTGNTAASLAAYAAQAGLPAVVLIPRGKVTRGKLAQSIAYGARTVEVHGDFDRCLERVEEACIDRGWYLLNSINPFRIAGQQTIILELLQQRSWEAPDWIVFPAGNLGNTSAFGRILRTVYRLGLIAKMPRLAAIQAEGAAPFARSFATGFRTFEPVEAETVATAIRIGNPASFDRAVRAIRDTNGVVIGISDENILTAKRIVDRPGIGCESASAAAVAGARALRAQGIIGPTEEVVAVLTGHLLKEPSVPGGADDPQPTTVEARPEDIKRVFD